ncbi:MAG: MogA/MoaB family molybdenum cofactor biosynthesis protein [Desulfitobacterium sp.]|nr:MogA/MoaB family molybdenum cofactor biosynthesis protein [Desulfitobacterium sp.]
MIKVGIITASDKGSQGEREDRSGEALKELVKGINGEVVKYAILPDDLKVLADTMSQWADEGEVDLLLTTGGTGFSPRDVTPEATIAVAERMAPGIAEVMRYESLKVTPMGMLSRAVAALRKKTLIINMPGSPKAVKECWNAIAPALPHGIEILKGEASECASNKHLHHHHHDHHHDHHHGHEDHQGHHHCHNHDHHKS